MDKQTSSVINRFRDAFQKHDPRGLSDITAEDCVLETPDGARYEDVRPAWPFGAGLKAIKIYNLTKNGSIYSENER